MAAGQVAVTLSSSEKQRHGEAHVPQAAWPALPIVLPPLQNPAWRMSPPGRILSI